MVAQLFGNVTELALKVRSPLGEVKPPTPN